MLLTISPIPFFLNSTTGWISTANGEVYRTNGSVNSWSKATFAEPPTKNSFIPIFATDANTVYLGSIDGIYKSTDGGANFTKINSAIKSYFSDIVFVDATTGYICAGTKIFKTTDSGLTWNVVVTVANESIVELYFTDANHGWASGGKNILTFKQ